MLQFTLITASWRFGQKIYRKICNHRVIYTGFPFTGISGSLNRLVTSFPICETATPEAAYFTFSSLTHCSKTSEWDKPIKKTTNLLLVKPLITVFMTEFWRYTSFYLHYITIWETVPFKPCVTDDEWHNKIHKIQHVSEQMYCIVTLTA
jgi:hypothetical protein